MKRCKISLGILVCFAILIGKTTGHEYPIPSNYHHHPREWRGGFGGRPHYDCVTPVYGTRDPYAIGYRPVPYQHIGGGRRYGGDCGGCRRPALFPRVRRLMRILLPPYDGRY